MSAAHGAPDARVRVTALGALVRISPPRAARDGWPLAAADPDPTVRRRAAELAPALTTVAAPLLIALVADEDQLVAEAACFAAGEIEWSDRDRREVVGALVRAAAHDDALIRESAVAALGSLGDPDGLDAILAACSDRPTVRRRAVLALAPFDDPRVDAAIEAARRDTDWQTRQAGEDLTAEGVGLGDLSDEDRA
ncbi:MAG: HEAT repeat domain-containing protein [Acidimicrobiia bacterium]|nr:HEAT repeat domain-containing protein [Acidimicrobiia bacterium]